MRIVLWCVGVVLCLNVQAQRISTDSLRRALLTDSTRKQIDTLQVKDVPDSLKKVGQSTKLSKVLAIFKKDTTTKLNPRRVTIHSAILPGWGQYDVKQWWLIPPIYGGFVLAGLAINFNQTRYKTYVGAYVALSQPKASADTTIEGRRFNVTQLRTIKNGYRRNRDVSYMSVLGIWAFQMIEANVAAHLKTFDVSDDLTLKIRPAVVPAFGTLTYGMKLEFALINRKQRPIPK